MLKHGVATVIYTSLCFIVFIEAAVPNMPLPSSLSDHYSPKGATYQVPSVSVYIHVLQIIELLSLQLGHSCY